MGKTTKAVRGYLWVLSAMVLPLAPSSAGELDLALQLGFPAAVEKDPFLEKIEKEVPSQAIRDNTRRRLPSGFQWCVATAAHQIEGYNENSDWWHWELIPGNVKNGDHSGPACDHWNRVEPDTELLVGLKVGTYRLSVEWAKIEPQPGQWNQDALEHYRTEIELLVSKGIRPMVTLQHFTLPQWVRARGGWEWSGADMAFERFVNRVYLAFGHHVRDWITVNEPMVSITLGYLAALAPPSKSNMDEAIVVAKSILRAHARAYHALHANAARAGRPVRVGIAQHMRVFEANSVWNYLDGRAAKYLDDAFNWAFLDAIETGRLQMYIPFALSVNAAIPGLKGTQDFIGVNYYTRDMVKVDAGARPLPIVMIANPAGPFNDLGWEIYPKGIYRMLRLTHHKYPRRPIVITENGTADRRDAFRKKFLYDHLFYVHEAIKKGVPVEGYCHWSLMDNFEWSEGFSPRFGLYGVDYSTQTRTLRESGRYYSTIAESNSF